MRKRDSSYWISTTCPVCGKVFEYPRSLNKPRKYCSYACKREGYATGKTTFKRHDSKWATATCPTCGNAFQYYLSWPRKYCSKACSGQANITNIAHFQTSLFTTTCEQCGKSFETTPKATRGRFCSRRCYGKWFSAHSVGEANPKFGKKYGRPKHLPPPTTKVCGICGKEFVTKQSHLYRRRFCSKACMAASLAVRMRGEANFNWQGGYEPYYGPTWRAARRDVLERDKVCQRCGMTPEQNGRDLDVHHIKPFRTFGITRSDEANDTSNLIALCHDCHLIVEWETNR